MPVFRDEAVATVFTAEQRKAVVDQLTRELDGETTPNGPVIFEISLVPPDRFDVLVVWDAWEPLGSQDRSNIILQAYDGRGLKIAQALGVTYQEAVEQQVLPYAVIPMARPEEADTERLKREMVAEGGFTLANGKVDLRFPTMTLAERAHRLLSQRLPQGYWSIAQTVASIP
jgi:hypothetical protein